MRPPALRKPRRLLAKLHQVRTARIGVAGGGAGCDDAPVPQATALGLPRGQPQPPKRPFPQRFAINHGGDQRGVSYLGNPRSGHHRPALSLEHPARPDARAPALDHPPPQNRPSRAAARAERSGLSADRKLMLQRWIGAPDFPSEWAGTGLTSLKRKQRAFENTYRSMPFACASGLL